MLADGEDAIDGQLASTQRQRIGDGRHDREPVGRREAIGEVGRMGLVQVERNDITWRRVVLVVDPVTFQESGDEVVAVRAHVIGAGNGRDLLARCAFEGKGWRCRQAQEFSTSHFFAPFGPSIFLSAGRVNRLSVSPLLMVTLSENISKIFSPFRSRSISYGHMTPSTLRYLLKTVTSSMGWLVRGSLRTVTWRTGSL